MLQLTDNLHQFHQQANPEEIYVAISELCYVHHIEIIRLLQLTCLSKYLTNQPAKAEIYSTLEGTYHQLTFLLLYNPIDSAYLLYIHGQYIHVIHQFQEVLQCLQAIVNPKSVLLPT